jgi:hypothetical protein
VLYTLVVVGAETIDATRIQPRHEIRDEDKLADLVESLTAHGWQGPPIVTIPGEDFGWGPGDPRAITGSHRIGAARQVDIEIPTIDLDEILAAHGTSLAALTAEYGDEDEAIIRLSCHLPAHVVVYYGLDAH